MNRRVITLSALVLSVVCFGISQRFLSDVFQDISDAAPQQQPPPPLVRTHITNHAFPKHREVDGGNRERVPSGDLFVPRRVDDATSHTREAINHTKSTQVRHLRGLTELDVVVQSAEYDSTHGALHDTSTPTALPYTTWRCVESPSSTNSGSINTTCHFHNLYYIGGRFTVYVKKRDDANVAKLPLKLSIGSVPEILYSFCNLLVTESLPRDAAQQFEVERELLLYLSAIVPWNFAHTLFSDLFPAFWMMWQHDMVQDSAQVIISDFFKKTFPLPNRNTAWAIFSHRPPSYKAYYLDDRMRKAGGVRLLNVLMGTGAKGWAHYHPSYRSPGSEQLWWDFRRHLFDTSGVNAPDVSDGVLRIVLCRKKDKRRILNSERLAKDIQEKYPKAEVRVVEFTELTGPQQLEVFAHATIFVSNEGTSATYFFLMPRGSAFISIGQYYGTQFRPNPKKRVGGSVDWFAPAIPWVRTSYYEDIREEDVVRDVNIVTHNRNAEFSVNVVLQRLAPLLDDAVLFVKSRSVRSDLDGYSTTGRICSALFSKHPQYVEWMLSRKCIFPASYYCEHIANSDVGMRGKHYRYRGTCPSGAVDVPDPR